MAMLQTLWCAFISLEMERGMTQKVMSKRDWVLVSSSPLEVHHHLMWQNCHPPPPPPTPPPIPPPIPPEEGIVHLLLPPKQLLKQHWSHHPSHSHRSRMHCYHAQRKVLQFPNRILFTSFAPHCQHLCNLILIFAILFCKIDQLIQGILRAHLRLVKDCKKVYVV